MNFIFYQNILSIHQSAFIRNLAENHCVYLIVEKTLNSQREKEGWNTPDFGKAQIFIAPAIHFVNKLLDREDFVHVFSGINSFPLISNFFRLAVKRNAKIGVILEPFDWTGWRGKLRYWKYFVLNLRYGKKIDFLLTIGNRGRWCFEKTRFSKAKIYDWAYFVEDISFQMPIERDERLPNIIFVGRLDHNKNILPLVSVCKKIRTDFNNLEIIGDGPLKSLLLEILKDTDFKYLGILPNYEVRSLIGKSDLLVLPSIYKDGWGTVVNEALMCGVPVIVSENCGASVLLNKHDRGAVFSVRDDNLQTILVNFLKKLPYNLRKRQSIRDWALSTISGAVAADYFDGIVKYIYCKSGIKPHVPWLND